MARLPSSTALAALPALALDLETTGLDARADRIVQVAAIAMLGPRVLDEPRFERIVDPGVPIPAVATGIHGLGEAQVAGAPKFAQVVEPLRELFEGRAIVGHRIAFDLACLRNEAARIRVAWHEPPALDVAMLFGALEPSLVDLSLEAIAARLEVTIKHRHTALGDAMAAAEIFTRLLSRLRDIDVRTLGEAQALAARRADLLRRTENRWPAPDASAAATAIAAPRIDTYIFERRVDEVMSAPPVLVAAGATLREAAQTMIARRIGALLVAGPGGGPEGILTERDLLRASAQRSFDEPGGVRETMSVPVQCIGRAELLYRALGSMDRGGFRHLCVVDAAGTAVGMLSQRDLLRHRARAALALEDDVARAEDSTSLAAAYGRVPLVAERLMAEGVAALDVARVISTEIRALTARAAQIVAGRLAAQGANAPAPWCLLVLGSAGRGESLLGADQDNALIHAAVTSDEAWFARLGDGIAELLDEVGVPRCRGGVMAANAAWRGTPSEWRERIAAWLQRARPEDLLNVDIFFDLMPVAGDAELARALQADAFEAAAHAPRFIALMAAAVSQISPSIGLFGGLKTEAGRIDLKRGGLLPLTGLARTLALRVGSSERSTPGRLRAAAAGGRLADTDAITLVGLHHDLLNLVLRQQLSDLAQGVRPSSRVAVRALGRDTAKRLARDLKRLDDMLIGLRGAVAG